MSKDRSGRNQPARPRRTSSRCQQSVCKSASCDVAFDHLQLLRWGARLVVSIAHGYRGVVSPLEALMEAGDDGLVRARARFSIGKEVGFSTYATSSSVRRSPAGSPRNKEPDKVRKSPAAE